jgi:hypothetical protein
MRPILADIADCLIAQGGAASLDPAAIPPALLPHIFVLDIDRGAAASVRLRIRLTGTAIDDVLGRRLKGRYLDEFMHGPQSAEVLGAFRLCAESGQPIWMRQIASLGHEVPRYVEGVAIRLNPDRLCGGLMIGEWTSVVRTPSFECAALG